MDPVTQLPMVIGSSCSVLTAGRSVAAPEELAYGTRLRLDGLGEQIFVVEDRTADWVQEKYGRTIDLYVVDHETAVRWGSQELEVFIEKEVK